MKYMVSLSLYLDKEQDNPLRTTCYEDEGKRPPYAPSHDKIVVLNAKPKLVKYLGFTYYCADAWFDHEPSEKELFLVKQEFLRQIVEESNKIINAVETAVNILGGK